MFSINLDLENIIRLFATINQRYSDFFSRQAIAKCFSSFQIYLHKRTRTLILVGFEQLLDVLKYAILESLFCLFRVF